MEKRGNSELRKLPSGGDAAQHVQTPNRRGYRQELINAVVVKEQVTPHVGTGLDDFLT